MDEFKIIIQGHLSKSGEFVELVAPEDVGSEVNENDCDMVV
jgi:hypothetical protein